MWLKFVPSKTQVRAEWYLSSFRIDFNVKTTSDVMCWEKHHQKFMAVVELYRLQGVMAYN